MARGCAAGPADRTESNPEPIERPSGVPLSELRVAGAGGIAMSSSTSVTRTLPTRPDLEQLKRQAKDLLADARQGNPPALARLDGNISARLADAQFVIAREHGFASWARIRRAVLAASPQDRPVTRPPRVDKHLVASTYNAATFLDGAKRNGWVPGRLPTSLVFVFQPVYANRLSEDPRFVEDTAMAVGNGRYFITVDDPAVAVSCMSAGTAFVGQVENQIALGGADRFVILNTAGGFGPDIAIGDLAVIETAVRDDGISDHYLPPGDTVDADETLTETLLEAARTVQPRARRHISWTIPAVFRQTQPEVDHCVNQGITVVESEIAALLAVCEARKVRAGAVVTVLGVQPPPDDAPADWNNIATTQWDVFEAVVTALRSH